MLGWQISIYKQQNDGDSPATAESSKGVRLPVWQAGLGGLDWIYEVINAGNAVGLGGDGYPCRFTMIFKHLIPVLLDGPPAAENAWATGPSETILDGWQGKTVIDHDVEATCRPDEWLLVEAWDVS